jgi:gluconate kinase
MNQPHKFIVMSGLPGSGKTTIGRKLADALGFQFLDKDDILESLLSAHTEFSSDLRHRLSRESDTIFRERAMAAKDAVITSFWRARNGHSAAGTPSDWLTATTNQIIEVFCRCDRDIAVDRFLNRKRHPGHMDHLKNRSMLQEQFANLAGTWPLGHGDLIEVDTSNIVNIDSLVERIRVIWPHV